MSAGVHATLQLLQGPTRLAVGALGGVAAAEVLLGTPAGCYVYRQPYDEEAFQSMYGATPTQRALASSKPKRPVGAVALKRICMPGHLAVTCGRNVGLTVLLTFNRWLLAAIEEDERAEAEGREAEFPPLQWSELGRAFWRGMHNAGVDLGVQATRCWLDSQALLLLPAHVAKKLIKDLKLSVARKGRLAWYVRAVRVTKTAAYSEATWWAADFMVSCVLEVLAAVRKSAGSWQQRTQRVLLRCGLHAVRAGMVLAAVAASYGVGSVAPRARSLTTWACSMGASFMVNGYMISFINRLAPLAPAGGDGPPAGGAAPAAGQGHHGIVMVGQQVHPAAAVAMAAAAAAGAPAWVGAGGEQVPNGVADQGVQAGVDGAAGAAGLAEGGEVAGAAAARAAQEAAAPMQQQDAGVQAGAPNGGMQAGAAAEPPIPAPQQRRVVGGPRLPDRPPRRNAAAGPGPDGDQGVGAAAFVARLPLAPPPAAPHTPQFRDQRAPTPSGDSEEAEIRAAAAAAAAAGSPAGIAAAGSSSSSGSEVPGAASPAGAGAGGSGSSSAAAEAPAPVAGPAAAELDAAAGAALAAGAGLEGEVELAED